MIQVVPAMTGLIDRLENQGFVERRRCEDDRRVVYIKITEKAAELLERMDKPLAALHRELMGHMTKAELRQLSQLLEKSRSKMQS
jgi:DNA-binding MarR family transcriptional regulator